MDKSSNLYLGLRPVQVSPLIKFARWSLLITGIFYGISKHALYSEFAVKNREDEEAHKKIREEQLAAERKISSDRDIQFFSDLVDEKMK